MSKTSAKALVRKHGIAAEHALYRKSGDWYHILRSFPGALMDANGFLIFASVEEYDDFVVDREKIGIKQNLETNTLIVKSGISSHSAYVWFTETFLASGEEELQTNVTEGNRRLITVNVYERDASARRRCIKHWGLQCSVCAFDFAARYGTLGDGYIHIHHLIPVSSYKVEYSLDPERDLRPVCANCHAMLHRHDPPLSIEGLKARLQKT